MIQRIELALQRNFSIPNSYKTGPKLENTNLLVLYSSPPTDFFKLFLIDNFVTKMAEQTNFYAIQRGAPGSLKPVSEWVINLYLYINIHIIRYHQESSQRSYAFFPSKCIIFDCFNSIAFQACQEDDPCFKKHYHILCSKESVILYYM